MTDATSAAGAEEAPALGAEVDHDLGASRRRRLGRGSRARGDRRRARRRRARHRSRASHEPRAARLQVGAAPRPRRGSSSASVQPGASIDVRRSPGRSANGSSKANLNTRRRSRPRTTAHRTKYRDSTAAVARKSAAARAPCARLERGDLRLDVRGSSPSTASISAPAASDRLPSPSSGRRGRRRAAGRAARGRSSGAARPSAAGSSAPPRCAGRSARAAASTSSASGTDELVAPRAAGPRGAPRGTVKSTDTWRRTCSWLEDGDRLHAPVPPRRLVRAAARRPRPRCRAARSSISSPGHAPRGDRVRAPGRP